MELLSLPTCGRGQQPHDRQVGAGLRGPAQVGEELSSYGLRGDAEMSQQLLSRVVLHPQNPEKYVLGAKVPVFERERLTQGKFEHLFRVRGERNRSAALLTVSRPAPRDSGTPAGANRRVQRSRTKALLDTPADLV